MDSKFAGIGLFAALAVGSVALTGCSAQPASPAATTEAVAAPAVSATTAVSTAADAAPKPVVKATPEAEGPVGGTGGGKPATTVKGLPDSATLVTVAVVGRNVSLTGDGRAKVRASATGKALKFHLIGFDDAHNYQFSLAGNTNRCLQREDDPYGHVQLAECSVDEPSQRFRIEAARKGYYIGGTAERSEEYLYQGVGDIASFDVTAEFEPDHWKFVEHEVEPLD